MTRKKFLASTISIFIFAIIISIVIICLNNTKPKKELIQYVGSISSLISTLSLFKIWKKIIYNSINWVVGYFYIFIMIFYLLINFISIILPIFIISDILNIGPWYFAIINFVFFGFLWFVFSLFKLKDGSGWIKFLFEKPGFYNKTIMRYSKKEKNIESKILEFLKGKIKNDNYKNVEKNLMLINPDFGIDFYIKLYINSKKEERSCITNIYPFINNIIERVCSLNVKWIEKNLNKHEKFIDICLNDNLISQELNQSAEYYMENKITSEYMLTHFIFNFPKELSDVMNKILSNIENGKEYMAEDLLSIEKVYKEWENKITNEKLKKVKKVLQIIFAKISLQYNKEIIDILIDNWGNYDYMNNELINYFTEMRSI
ncbi:MAG: hypothetical protein GY679_03940 [Mycoplasma sp.]|nr:hypothetical protein [Mycoplasma sp.]